MLNAILPVFLLIVIGFTIRHFRWLSDDFWNDAEKLVYFVLFPAMLISKMSVADLSNADAVPLISVLCLSLGIMSALTFILKSFLNIENASFTSFFQGAIRINTFVGLALAENILGNSGLITAVIIAAILIPLVNLIVVIVLQNYREKNGQKDITANLKSTIIQLIKNPLIMGCTIGLILNFSQIILPAPLQISINILGSTALPLGLLAVGAALVFKDLKSVMKPLLVSSSLRLLIYPLLVYALTNAFSFNRETQIAILIFSAVPTAASSYILAKNMGGDHQLMSRIITFQTLFSSITIFLMFWLLGV